MKEHFEDPPRWREHSDQSGLAERTIARDLRAIKTPAPLSDPQMARIAAGLRPSHARRSLRWLVLAASLILGVATAASAAHHHLLPHWLTGASAPPPAPTPEPRTGHRKLHAPGLGHAPRPKAVLGATEDVPAPPTSEAQAPKLETPSPSREEAVPPTSETQTIPDKPLVTTQAPRQGSALIPSARRAFPRRESSTGASPPAPIPMPPLAPQAAAPNVWQPPPPVISPPAASPPPPPHGPPAPVSRVAMLDPPRPSLSKPTPEFPKPVTDDDASKLLADAIRLVRTDGQPQSALALLDRQATQLERSPYRHEALLIRVEALLVLKRDADLLRLLDGMPLADVAASRTLLTTRGRLRAAAQRCAEAVADFDRVLSEPGRKNRQALLGRALCREVLGDREGARVDRERYRQESSPAPGTESSGP